MGRRQLKCFLKWEPNGSGMYNNWNVGTKWICNVERSEEL